jgi:phosphoglycolate phosphatase-like HAD superfamily hydrolase
MIAYLFDLHGVLTQGYSYPEWKVYVADPVCEEFLGRTLSREEWKDIIYNGKRREFFEKLGINYSEFWRAIDARDFKITKELLKKGSISVYEDVCVLKELEGKKGIVSNGYSRSLKLILDHFGLTKHFETIQGRMISKIDWNKPSPHLIIKTLREMGVEHGNAVYVDDSDVGIIAANRVKENGLRCLSVYINRNGTKNPRADYNISSLVELLSLPRE